MKHNNLLVVIAILISLGITFVISTTNIKLPNNYYKVYLDGEVLGVVTSKEKLKNYINENGEYYKKKYNVSKIYAPSGLRVEKLKTYNGKTENIKTIYKKIKKNANFTVNGYEFTITKTINEDGKEKNVKNKINVLEKKVFKEAVNTIISTYVGEDEYNLYINNNQKEIEGTGEKIENVYINENITYKKKKISVNKTIYSNAEELGKYLLYGNNYEEKTYTVNAGDTIETVAFKNQVSEEELLLANDNLNNKSNLLYQGEQLKIAVTNPQISVVEEKYTVNDVESTFQTEEKYDDNLVLGSEEVIQEGQNGINRVSQEEKIINGDIVYVEPKDKQIIKNSTTRIIKKGNKYIPTVGSLTNWGWPTDSGWTLSSNYAYRNSPLGRGRELHTGLDISGTGYGSNIYATNNGVVMIAEYHYSYGYYVVINHNNGYMTLYAHMSKIAAKVGATVAKGDVIGYVGSTGDSTGPHVHYEVWKGSKWNHVNPLVLYPNGY